MRIAVLTSGGDAPGMNACILNLLHHGFMKYHEMFLVMRGLKGLYENQIMQVDENNLNWDYLNQAGSFIFSARFPEFINDYEVCIKNLQDSQIDVLVIIGGNGSLEAAKLLTNHGIKTLFIPATIDNDVNFTDATIGFQSSVQEVVNDFYKLKKSFETHNNICWVEVMGRHCSDIAINTGLAVHPDLCLTHQNKLSLEEVVQQVWQKYQFQGYAMIIASEYVYSYEEQLIVLSTLKKQSENQVDPRRIVIGHLQRGADVVANDLILANRLAASAILAVDQGFFDAAIYTLNNEIKITNYQDLTEHKRDYQAELGIINNNEWSK